MYFIEHSGSEAHTRIANNVGAKLNYHLEHIIGRNWDDLILYNREMKQLAVFNSEPSAETLEFLTNMDSANEDSIY